MTITPELQQKIALARSKGIPEDIINQKVQQYQTQANPQGGVLTSLAHELIRPAVQYGKYVGEAAAQVGRVAMDPVYRKSVMGGQLNEEEAQHVANQPVTAFLNENEVANRGEIAKTGLKATAGAASYAIPGGSSYLGAAGLGAIAGGLHAYSDPNATVDSVAGGALGGGIGGAAFHGAGQAINKAKSTFSNARETVSNLVGSQAQKAGKNLETRAFVSKFGKPSLAEGGDKVIQHVNDLGFHTAKDAQELADQTYTAYTSKGQQLADSIKSATDSKGVTLSKQDLVNFLDKKIKSESLPSNKIPWQTVKNDLAELPDQLPASEFYKLKQAVGLKPNWKNPAEDGVNNAYKSLYGEMNSKLDTALKDNGVQDFRDLNDQISRTKKVYDFASKRSNTVSGTKGLSLKEMLGYGASMATGNPAMAGVTMAAENPAIMGKIGKGVSAFGDRVANGTPSAGIASARDVTAQTFGQKADQFTGSAVKKVLTSPQLLPQIAGSKAVLENQPQQQPMTQQTSQPQGGFKLTQQQVADAYLKLPKAEADKVAKYYAMQNGGTGKQLSAEAAKLVANASLGINAITQMKQMIQANPYVIAQAKIPGSPGARTYETFKTHLGDILARTRTGAAMSQQEQKIYLEQLMPAPLDSQQTINAKLDSLGQLFSQESSLVTGE